MSGEFLGVFCCTEEVLVLGDVVVVGVAGHWGEEDFACDFLDSGIVLHAPVEISYQRVDIGDDFLNFVEGPGPKFSQ